MLYYEHKHEQYWCAISEDAKGLAAVIADIKRLQTERITTIDVEREDILGVAMGYFKTPGCELRPLAVNMKTDGLQESINDRGELF